MYKNLFATIFFVFGLHIYANAQSFCKLDSLIVRKSECNTTGEFFVEIDFFHTGTSDFFTLAGNGIFYGKFSYSALPLKIGPLKGNCTTPYEFVVRDFQFQDCFTFVELGKVCCDKECTVTIDEAAITACHESSADVFVRFNKFHTTASQFDVFYKDSLIGFYTKNADTIRIKNVPANNGNENIILKICANDMPDCCDTVVLSNPCHCKLYGARGQVVECSGEHKLFSVLLTVQNVFPNDSFYLFNGMHLVGKFAYNNLPLRLDSLPFRDDAAYVFTFKDADNPDCVTHYELGKVTGCEFPCSISDIRYELSNCTEDGNYFLFLKLKDRFAGVFGFTVSIGTYFRDTLVYGRDVYKIGPIPAKCDDVNHLLVIKPIEIQGCGTEINLPLPSCCEKECKIGDIVIQEKCEQNFLVSYSLTFNHQQNPARKFSLFADGKLVGTYSYSQLPLQLLPAGLTLPGVLFVIKDLEADSCFSVREYVFECKVKTPCDFSEVILKKTPCNEDGFFYALISFRITNPGSTGFTLKSNSGLIKTFNYGKDVYEFGPLKGDCTTKYRFVLKDNSKPDCVEELGFEAPVCCEKECSMSGPPQLEYTCKDGKYDVTINFGHKNTSSIFIMKMDGIVRGLYSYSDLPVTIRGLNPEKTYELLLIDQEKESCNIKFILPVISCSTGTEDNLLSQFKIKTSQELINVNTENLVPGKVKLTITDILGRTYHHQNMDKNDISIDISTLRPGIYMLSIQINEKLQTKKFIKI